MEQFYQWLKSYGLFVVAGVVGLGIVGYGVYLAVVPEKPVVEIVSESEIGDRNIVMSGNTIYVDVAGAVEKPGVYKLQTGSRIGDALIAAGGFSEEADQAWVAKTLNLAAEVKDGGKIYIPEMNGNRESETSNIIISEGHVAGTLSGLVNINTASESELDSLWGIGEARAKAIIENRPYDDIEELVSKAGVPQNVYDKIKEQVSVY